MAFGIDLILGGGSARANSGEGFTVGVHTGRESMCIFRAEIAVSYGHGERSRRGLSNSAWKSRNCQER